MKDFLVMESQLSALPPKRRRQAEKLLELVRRVMEEAPLRSISKPEDVYQTVAADMSALDKEHFVIILLDSKNRIISIETISVGTLNSAIVHPREVFKPAITKGAASIICVHNHPSGDPTPSPEDICLTEILIDAGKIIDIDVLDHIVIGTEGYISLREQGLV
ncbi:DNA repair protein RadC [Paenibacillus thiaminolyticus]|uniref:RadC family protein n=1 Tax=Paenibacillus thiaminolyticus TaxID=49283 RepID=UPI00232CDC0A|nr:DNA repair protein RadC [Paenibacillus thiaminolyticus]WCF05938.1 DNA repair protein RadC [Paenibacillus thiaminolyticus]